MLEYVSFSFFFFLNFFNLIFFIYLLFIYSCRFFHLVFSDFFFVSLSRLLFYSYRFFLYSPFFFLFLFYFSSFCTSHHFILFYLILSFSCFLFMFLFLLFSSLLISSLASLVSFFSPFSLSFFLSNLFFFYNSIFDITVFSCFPHRTFLFFHLSFSFIYSCLIIYLFRRFESQSLDKSWLSRVLEHPCGHKVQICNSQLLLLSIRSKMFANREFNFLTSDIITLNGIRIYLWVT